MFLYCNIIINNLILIALSNLLELVLPSIILNLLFINYNFYNVTCGFILLYLDNLSKYRICYIEYMYKFELKAEALFK